MAACLYLDAGPRKLQSGVDAGENRIECKFRRVRTCTKMEHVTDELEDLAINKEYMYRPSLTVCTSNHLFY